MVAAGPVRRLQDINLGGPKNSSPLSPAEFVPDRFPSTAGLAYLGWHLLVCSDALRQVSRAFLHTYIIGALVYQNESGEMSSESGAQGAKRRNFVCFHPKSFTPLGSPLPQACFPLYLVLRSKHLLPATFLGKSGSTTNSENLFILSSEVRRGGYHSSYRSYKIATNSPQGVRRRTIPFQVCSFSGRWGTLGF